MSPFWKFFNLHTNTLSWRNQISLIQNHFASFWAHLWPIVVCLVWPKSLDFTESRVNVEYPLSFHSIFPLDPSFRSRCCGATGSYISDVYWFHTSFSRLLYGMCVRCLVIYDLLSIKIDRQNEWKMDRWITTLTSRMGLSSNILGFRFCWTFLTFRQKALANKISILESLIH